mmetsp:Transcript_7286/g.27377  ORF Transcript_7286/g.27377 Transcript_7286/m.27377 type:complete len:283 (-) Transcript_7286:465-1313(-)
MTPPPTSLSEISFRDGDNKSVHFLPAISKYATRTDKAPGTCLVPVFAFPDFAFPPESQSERCFTPAKSASIAVRSRCSMVCVLPLPVCPYTSMAPFTPLMRSLTRGAPVFSYTERCEAVAPNTASNANSRRPTPGATAKTRPSSSSTESTPHVNSKPERGLVCFSGFGGLFFEEESESFSFVTSFSAPVSASGFLRSPSPPSPSSSSDDDTDWWSSSSSSSSYVSQSVSSCFTNALLSLSSLLMTFASPSQVTIGGSSPPPDWSPYKYPSFDVPPSPPRISK